MLFELIRKKITSSKLLSRVVHSASWSLLATLGTRGLRLVAMILVARILDKETYGELGIVLGSVVMFTTFAAAGMGVTAARYVGGHKHEDKELTSRVISMSIISTTVIGAVFSILLAKYSSWFSDEALHAPHLLNVIKVSAIILFLSTISNAQVGVLTGFEAFKSLAKVNIAVGVISLVLITSGAYYSGLYGCLWGMAVATMVEVAIYTVLINSEMNKYAIQKSPYFTMHELQIFKRFSLPALMSGVLVAPVLWLGSIMLVSKPDGYLEMAVMSVANQWFAIILFLPGVLTNALLPIFSECTVANDQVQLRKALSLSLKTIACVVVPIFLLILIFAPFIMRLYGGEYSGGEGCLIVISLAAIVAATQNMLGNLLAANNKMWQHFVTNIIWAIVYLCAGYLFVENNYGAFGLACALLVAYLVKVVAVIYVINKQIGVYRRCHLNNMS